MNLPHTEFYRIDPLTGSNNFLSFVETLNELSSRETKVPFSILYADLNYLKQLNEIRGHIHGDSAIRWLGIVLQEESEVPTYRIGGDDFVVLLTDGLHADYEDLLKRIFTRLNKEGGQLGLASPAASIALIHYDRTDYFTFNDVMFQLGETMLDVKRNTQREVQVYKAETLIKSTARASEQKSDTLEYSWELLRLIANDAIHRLVMMGRVLDVAQKNSYLDSISGLPNLRAATNRLEQAVTTNQPFAILLMDGDNLRLFNSISYADGDEAIQDMGRILSENLRPGDFLARWRAGDEFIAILPNTSAGGAKAVGERCCNAIRQASQDWKFPTSISVGIAIFPKHGNSLNTLIDAAETANKKAKDAGKDQVVIAE